MGNRAVISFKHSQSAPAIYIHWNGGPESIEAFLEVCRRRGYRTPGSDTPYAFARLVGVLHEFFNGDSSVAVGLVRELDADNGDNGWYILGDTWHVKKRVYADTETMPELTKEEKAKRDAIVDNLMKNWKETQ